MEDWEKVKIAEEFLADRHFVEFFNSDCKACHGGVEPAPTRAEAHIDLVAAPSYPDGQLCTNCHGQQVDDYHTSLHFENRGLYDIQHGQVAQRANPEMLAELEEGMTNHCTGCHVKACGDCHISRPHLNKKGFVAGHVFFKTPKATKNCTGCHGARVEKEMLAKGGEDIEGNDVFVVADVHWNPNAMTCDACHLGHGDQSGVYHRYDVTDGPTCEGCHPGVNTDSANAMHATHANPAGDNPLLQCHVCHSQPYNNCRSCHVFINEDEQKTFDCAKSWFQFKIGKNYLKSAKRPYDYVVVRHIPVDPDTFAYYGDDILSNFDAVPTWKYATPHNVIRQIKLPGDDEADSPPQARSCNSCHGHEELFLGSGDLDPAEVAANALVVVTDIPQTLPDGGPDGG